MFERLLEGMSRLSALGELFFSQNFFPLQLGDTLLVGRHHRAVARIHDAIKELIDLHFQLLDVRLQAFGGLIRLSKANIPRIAHQYLALTAYALIAVAHRCLKNPIAVLNPCPHTVHGLLTVLLALVL